MGSGKSTIASVLAQTLGYEFIDIDKEAETKSRQTIAEIFHTRGEEHFRALEHDILQTVSKRTGCVISLGGGTIINEQNLHLIKSSGLLVYLHASVEQIFQRVRLTTDRPLLKSPDGSQLDNEDLFSRIRVLLDARKPFYEQADLTIMTDDEGVGAAVAEIVKYIRAQVERGNG